MQSVGVVDAHFAEPRLAQIYDALDPVRGDLDAYLAMADEFGASTVLDVGCGTGTLACLLAQRDRVVVGVDPACASVEVARRKPGAERVRWLVGDATAIPEPQVDMVTMTGNVAQVFLTDQDWTATLTAARSALHPGGRLVFETRDPAKEAWRTWSREQQTGRHPWLGGVESLGGRDRGPSATGLVPDDLHFCLRRRGHDFGFDAAVP
jgi:ubiquinone/menaquinone biosynthesis C-methylase UbiE